VFNIGPVELFILVVIFGAVCAAIAHQKGHRPGRYFLVGVLLPVIGLIVTIAMPSRPGQSARTETR
jgi:predicted membrane protein